MSRARANAREARLAARAAEVARAQGARSRRERRAALAVRVSIRPRRFTSLVRRRDRRVLLSAIASFVVLQFAIWQLVDDTQTRLGLGLLTLVLLPIATHVLTDPRSRR